MLGTAVLSFVLLQDEYKSVMLSGVFWTAIATVGCRCYGDLPKLSLSIPCDLQSSTAMFIPWLVSACCLEIFTNFIIHNYAGRSDSLGTIVLPAARSVSSIL